MNRDSGKELIVFLMKRRFFLYLCILIGSLAACGRRSVPVFADADSLAMAIYTSVGFETESLYAERLESTDAYRFGINISEFDHAVEDGICYRKLLDDNGQMLYVLNMHSCESAEHIAKTFFSHYEFAPCDAAEKMTVISAGNYIIFFKSDVGEVDAVSEGVFTLMNGRIDFQKEAHNHG